MKKAYSTPQIFGMGKITRAENFDSNELFIKWEIINGSNYKLIDGKIKGETFQSTSHVWSTDNESRNYLIGYGTMFFPFKTGHSEIKVECWRPTKTFRYNLSENFLHSTPEFIDKSAIYATDEKFGMTTISTGCVLVEIDIIMKDFDLHGIRV